MSKIIIKLREDLRLFSGAIAYLKRLDKGIIVEKCGQKESLSFMFYGLYFEIFLFVFEKSQDIKVYGEAIEVIFP